MGDEEDVKFKRSRRRIGKREDTPQWRKQLRTIVLGAIQLLMIPFVIVVWEIYQNTTGPSLVMVDRQDTAPKLKMIEERQQGDIARMLLDSEIQVRNESFFVPGHISEVTVQSIGLRDTPEAYVRNFDSRTFNPREQRAVVVRWEQRAPVQGGCYAFRFRFFDNLGRQFTYLNSYLVMSRRKEPYTADEIEACEELKLHLN